MSSKGTRTGRPAGGGQNSDKILAAAREQFAAKGFRASTMRSIAAQAGFDVALVAHYFGSKDELLAATMELPDGIDQLFVEALTGPLETQGERLARGYLGLWESPVTGVQMRVLARSALTNEAAGVRIRDLLSGLILAPAAADLLEGRRTGFSLAMSQLLGAAFARHLTQMPALTNLAFEELVARLAPTVQLHLQCSDE